MHDARHDMRPVGTGLEKIVARSLHKAKTGEGPVLAWPLACGSTVAERTRALDFSKGILRVEVANAEWRKELQSLAPRYVALINRYVGENVTRIEFVIASQK